MGGAVTIVNFDASKLCPKCIEHYFDQPHLVGACASVGIEHGKSTAMMLGEYFAAFHANKHQEDK